MVFRAQPLALWTVLAAALCLCSWSAPPWTGAEAILDSATAESLVALEQDYAVVAPAPTLIIRAVLNGGDVSPHKVSFFLFFEPPKHTVIVRGKRQALTMLVSARLLAYRFVCPFFIRRTAPMPTLWWSKKPSTRP